jgi:hypothetical protein
MNDKKAPTKKLIVIFAAIILLIASGLSASG